MPSTLLFAYVMTRCRMPRLALRQRRAFALTRPAPVPARRGRRIDARDPRRRAHWPHMSDSGNDLFNAVQDWVAQWLRGERPSSLDYPRSGTRAGVPGTGIPGVTLRSSAGL
jgi:hypothetical protein